MVLSQWTCLERLCNRCDIKKMWQELSKTMSCVCVSISIKWTYFLYWMNVCYLLRGAQSGQTSKVKVKFAVLKVSNKCAVLVLSHGQRKCKCSHTLVYELNSFQNFAHKPKRTIHKDRTLEHKRKWTRVCGCYLCECTTQPETPFPLFSHSLQTGCRS